MKTFTIVRQGRIYQRPHGPHKCGFSKTSRYPYRVEVTVSGVLRGPQFFIVQNEEIHKVVVATFRAKRESESCEKMVDEICQAVLLRMRKEVQWKVERLHVELTGTGGRALLSCDWRRLKGGES